MSTKHCPKCNITKESTEFSASKRRKDGLQTECKACRKAMAHKHYEENKPTYLARGKQSTTKFRSWLNDLKNLPCTDCKVEYPYYVMDYDHVVKDKIDSVSVLKRSGNVKKVKAEIAKCEIVCANCHRIRTFNRYHP